MTHSSHIWEDVNGSLELRSTEASKRNKNIDFMYSNMLSTNKKAYGREEPSMFEGIVLFSSYLGKYAYSLSCRDLDERFDTILM